MDIICQVTTKCATVSKPKLFHQLNTPLVSLKPKLTYIESTVTFWCNKTQVLPEKNEMLEDLKIVEFLFGATNLDLI